MTQTRLLIDGFSLLYRAYYGYPSNLTTSNGTPINAAYGFVVLMLNAIKQFDPTHLVICLDRKEPTYRHRLFPDYKANRSAPDDDFLVQIPEFKTIIESFNIPLIDEAGYESDDLLGTLSRQYSTHDGLTIIMSGDMDMLQLVNDQTHVAINKKGVSNYVVYTADTVQDTLGLTVAQLIDFKALKGDASDNIPGVKGVGQKTAHRLLQDHGSLDAIYANIDHIASASIRTKLLDHKDMAYLSKQLVTIDCHAPISMPLSDCRLQPDWSRVHETFVHYQFKRLIHQLRDVMPNNTPITDTDMVADITTQSSPPDPASSYVPTAIQIIQTAADLNTLMGLLSHGFVLDLETTSLDPRDADIVAMAITASKGVSFIIDVRPSPDHTIHPLLAQLRPLLEHPDVPKWCHNAKYEIQVLATHGIQLKGVAFDSMVAAHLLGYDAIGLKSLANTLFNVTMTPFTDVVPEGTSILDVPLTTLARYAGDDSNMTYHLMTVFDTMLEEPLRSLFFDLECPLIHSLAMMEINGVQCDTDYLKQLSVDYHARLTTIEARIYTLAGRSDFNINSTQQLATVLFDDLALPTGTSNRSTNASVLESLAPTAPIAQEILNYRLYKKLLSTYIDRLPDLVHPVTKKIHTTFNQTITATGRLSSNHPNLQTIPIRSEEGQKIRGAFVSRFTDGIIMSVDYSQIELRLLAHLSGDPAMIQAFQDNQDIHQSTAANIFGVPYESVTKSQRNQAKTVNFGITYGQSAFALAKQLNIPRVEAKAIIDAYYAEFSQIQSYMNDVIDAAKRNGYVTTILGRIRHLSDASARRSVQNQQDRMAVNTTVQGSAADVIKRAMVHIARELHAFQSKLILQVHDELVFDVHPSETIALLPMITSAMTNAVTLRVPLTIDVASGPSWGVD